MSGAGKRDTPASPLQPENDNGKRMRAGSGGAGAVPLSSGKGEKRATRASTGAPIALTAKGSLYRAHKDTGASSDESENPAAAQKRSQSPAVNQSKSPARASTPLKKSGGSSSRAARGAGGGGGASSVGSGGGGSGGRGPGSGSNAGSGKGGNRRASTGAGVKRGSEAGGGRGGGGHRVTRGSRGAGGGGGRPAEATTASGGGSGDESSSSAPAAPRRRRGRKGRSIYRGVCVTREGKWRAVIYKERKQLYLGVYESELEAAKAHDRAARFHFPDKSMTNFNTEAEADRLMATEEHQKRVQMDVARNLAPSRRLGGGGESQIAAGGSGSTSGGGRSKNAGRGRGSGGRARRGVGADGSSRNFPHWEVDVGHGGDLARMHASPAGDSPRRSGVFDKAASPRFPTSNVPGRTGGRGGGNGSRRTPNNPDRERTAAAAPPDSPPSPYNNSGRRVNRTGGRAGRGGVGSVRYNEYEGQGDVQDDENDADSGAVDGYTTRAMLQGEVQGWDSRELAQGAAGSGRTGAAKRGRGPLHTSIASRVRVGSGGLVEEWTGEYGADGAGGYGGWADRGGGRGESAGQWQNARYPAEALSHTDEQAQAAEEAAIAMVGCSRRWGAAATAVATAGGGDRGGGRGVFSGGDGRGGGGGDGLVPMYGMYRSENSTRTFEKPSGWGDEGGGYSTKQNQEGDDVGDNSDERWQRQRGRGSERLFSGSGGGGGADGRSAWGPNEGYISGYSRNSMPTGRRDEDGQGQGGRGWDDGDEGDDDQEDEDDAMGEFHDVRPAFVQKYRGGNGGGYGNGGRFAARTAEHYPGWLPVPGEPGGSAASSGMMGVDESRGVPSCKTNSNKAFNLVRPSAPPATSAPSPSTSALYGAEGGENGGRNREGWESRDWDELAAVAAATVARGEEAMNTGDTGSEARFSSSGCYEHYPNLRNIVPSAGGNVYSGSGARTGGYQLALPLSSGVDGARADHGSGSLLGLGHVPGGVSREELGGGARRRSPCGFDPNANPPPFSNTGVDSPFEGADDDGEDGGMGGQRGGDRRILGLVRTPSDEAARVGAAHALVEGLARSLEGGVGGGGRTSGVTFPRLGRPQHRPPVFRGDYRRTENDIGSVACPEGDDGSCEFEAHLQESSGWPNEGGTERATVSALREDGRSPRLSPAGQQHYHQRRSRPPPSSYEDRPPSSSWAPAEGTASDGSQSRASRVSASVHDHATEPGAVVAQQPDNDAAIYSNNGNYGGDSQTHSGDNSDERFPRRPNPVVKDEEGTAAGAGAGVGTRTGSVSGVGISNCGGGVVGGRSLDGDSFVNARNRSGDDTTSTGRPYMMGGASQPEDVGRGGNGGASQSRFGGKMQTSRGNTGGGHFVRKDDEISSVSKDRMSTEETRNVLAGAASALD